MSASEEHEREQEVDDSDPDAARPPRGDLGSWLYVICGIPGMILFFVLYFGLIGSCDASNIMIHG